MGSLCSTKEDTNKRAKIAYKDIPYANAEINDIPNDQYLCPNCDKIPEILNIHEDNGIIELKCKDDGILSLTLKDYYEKMKNHLSNYYKTKCFNCPKEQNNQNNMFKYCYTCKVDFCEECVNNFHQRNKEHNRAHLDVCIPVNEKKHKCLDHFDSEIESFCLDCQENVCEKEIKTKHSGHTKINFTQFENDINQYIPIIQAKNKLLSDAIKFNQIILNCYEKFKNNYFHIQSLINIGKKIERDNKIDSKELEILKNDLEKRNKIQEEAKNEIYKNFNIKLKGNEEKLSLRNINLGDNGFKLISKIIFTNLKEIDVSQNGIKDITPLNNMILPHLEYLNMSNNQIENIEPIAELNSKKLKEICLQENEIKDVSSLLKSEFPDLERLRLEKNQFDKSLESFKQLINKKYKNKVFYKEITQEEFNKKYGIEIDLGKDSIEISNLHRSDELLLDLYLLVKPENKIKYLKLDDNKINNVSLLSRIPLDNLKLLDLSLNNITNLQFLKGVKMTELTTLYLNENKIYDIYPLIKIKEEENCCPKLSIISLKNNNLKIEYKESQKVIKKLWDKKIELDIEIPK